MPAIAASRERADDRDARRGERRQRRQRARAAARLDDAAPGARDRALERDPRADRRGDDDELQRRGRGGGKPQAQVGIAEPAHGEHRERRRVAGPRISATSTTDSEYASTARNGRRTCGHTCGSTTRNHASAGP
jgi:hypothetical protein